MPLKANSAAFRVSSAWEYEKTITGFSPASQRGSLSLSLLPDTDTLDHMFFDSFDLAAGASATVDLRAFTAAIGEAASITQAVTFTIKATALAAGGILRVEPGATNPLTWFFAGTSPAIVLNVGTLGNSTHQCGFAIQDGSTVVVSDTSRNLKVSNPGTATITVKLAASVGS